MMKWINERLPGLQGVIEGHLTKYPTPKNFNFWYFFGSLAMVVLVIQLLSGIWLLMHYVPTEEGAFASVEYIMRDVPWGNVIRYMHSTGASAFFIVIYLHMFRAVMYGSYQKPRELIWLLGALIFVVLMAEAFMGYLLPWGQMSYWGATVITSLFESIPLIGEDLVVWIRGDSTVSGATLSRFFALHVVALPLVLVMLVAAHILALHEVGSNNPDGIEIKKEKDSEGWPLDGVPFHPYFTIKDLVGVGVFAFFFAFIVFYAPEGGGYFIEKPNFEPANHMKTPEHVPPVWYFTPFYMILKAVPDPFFGFMAMAASIVFIFALPWLDRGKVRSWRYRSIWHRINILVFVVWFVTLGVLGTKAETPTVLLLGKVATIGYFMFFVLLFLYSKNESTKPVPKRVT